MLHFIPAWYQQNTWYETEQCWYVRRMHTEFDDAVKQVQLFHRRKAYPYNIMLLSYAPNFRHFLHRQGVLQANYWSCFDAIQEIQRKKARTVSFYNIAWPRGVEFVYSPFAVVANLNGEKYAQIEFGEDGNPIRIDMYSNGVLSRRNIYDDRGFISATILYENGKESYRDFLMENGFWKIRLFQYDGHVEVNPDASTFQTEPGNEDTTQHFSRLLYPSLDAVIEEVVRAYVASCGAEDIYCVSTHVQHNELLERVLSNRRMISSFFEKRYPIEDNEQFQNLLRASDYVVMDKKSSLDKVQQISKVPDLRIIDISPYDTRVDFGISQQLSAQKILVPIDDLEEGVFSQVIDYLGRYLMTNKKAEVYLFSREATAGLEQQVLERVRTSLSQAELDVRMAMDSADAMRYLSLMENGIDLEDYDFSQRRRFFVEQCVDELAVSKCMREQRLLVDLRPIPELYLQISAISMGIPQIVRQETQYIEHRGNGIVLKELAHLYQALDFYLDGMNNWNEAMIRSYEIGKNYTTAVLVDKWKEVLDTLG